MIHYHGTPVGGTRQDGARFLAGRHALVPFPRQDDMGIVAEVCQSFVFDNGAFSVWNKGGTLDVDGYTRWVEDWHRHPGFDWALIPDVIDGDEAANDALLAAWPRALRGVPVWHLHESLVRLQRLANEWPMVAFGSSGQWRSPGTAAWWKRMAAAMDAICDDQGRPTCRLHGLRMLDPAIFQLLPFASADSTNAAVNGGSISRFGMYAPPTAGQRACVIADRIESHNSADLAARGPGRDGHLIHHLLPPRAAWSQLCQQNLRKCQPGLDAKPYSPGSFEPSRPPPIWACAAPFLMPKCAPMFTSSPSASAA